MLIRQLGINVLEASRERIKYTFDNYERIYVSFSGGKDSTVMLHLVMEEAKNRDRRIGVLFIDWECQFTHTIDHIREMLEKYSQWIEPFWIQMPIRTWNGCSQFEPEWTSWDESKKELWVRDKEKVSVKDGLPFYYENMMFEEFTPLFAEWFSQGKSCACFIGIRTAESLNRYRTIAITKNKRTSASWITKVSDHADNVYPIYDWKTIDIWTYNGKHKKEYNPIYDYMHKAGMTIASMRIDEPFGDTQRQGLWLYQVIEPALWSKMVARVAGANTGALYCSESGNILGNRMIKLPDGKTWKQFSELLLETMPSKTSEHYKNKIAVYLKWFMKRGYEDGIPDQADYKLETYGKVPSWRRICKALLRNDYWCRSLGFSPTKSTAYYKYMNLMKRRRNEWKIFETKEPVNV